MSQNGISLVETLVVMALIGLLSVAGMSFTSGWSESNALLDGDNIIAQAYSRAKAAAIRNEFGVIQGAPAAAMCLANGTLSVRGAKSATEPAGCDASVTRLIWQQALNNRLQVKDGNAAFSCVCLTNKGHVTSTGCNSCSTNTSLTLKAGSNDQTLELF